MNLLMLKGIKKISQKISKHFRIHIIKLHSLSTPLIKKNIVGKGYIK